MLERRQQLTAIGWMLLTAVVTTVAVIHVITYPVLYYHIEKTPNNFELKTVFENESLDYSLEDLSTNDKSTLLNISNFQYLINNNVCKSEAPPLFLVFVHSAPDHVELRDMIRTTWGQEATLIFLLGLTTSTLQKDIEAENLVHHDIIQGNFVDSYRNLTYKHVMGFKWASYHCPGAKYLLKTDDDVFVNVLFLRKFIESKLSSLGARKLILCDIQLSVVQRSFRSKWRVSPKEYEKSWYPEVCKGWAILYSPDVSFHLYKSAKETPYFWIDDVYVTGILAQITNVTLTSVHPYAIYNKELDQILKKPYLEPHDDFLFCYPTTLISEMDSLWRIVKNTTRYFNNFNQNETYAQ